MNAMLILAVLCLLVAVAAIAWALKAQTRATTAEANLRALEGTHDLVRAQVNQSAASVAQEILRANDEAVRNREQLAQARLEAQLKPVAESLAKFQEQVTAVEKQRAEETGGLKEQITALLNASTATQDEARKLSAALGAGPACRAAGASRRCATCWSRRASPVSATSPNRPRPTPRRAAGGRM